MAAISRSMSFGGRPNNTAATGTSTSQPSQQQQPLLSYDMISSSLHALVVGDGLLLLPHRPRAAAVAGRRIRFRLTLDMATMIGVELALTSHQTQPVINIPLMDIQQVQLGARNLPCIVQPWLVLHIITKKISYSLLFPDDDTLMKWMIGLQVWTQRARDIQIVDAPRNGGIWTRGAYFARTLLSRVSYNARSRQMSLGAYARQLMGVPSHLKSMIKPSVTVSSQSSEVDVSSLIEQVNRLQKQLADEQQSKRQLRASYDTLQQQYTTTTAASSSSSTNNTSSHRPLHIDDTLPVHMNPTSTILGTASAMDDRREHVHVSSSSPAGTSSSGHHFRQGSTPTSRTRKPLLPSLTATPSIVEPALPGMSE